MHQSWSALSCRLADALGRSLRLLVARRRQLLRSALALAGAALCCLSTQVRFLSAARCCRVDGGGGWFFLGSGARAACLPLHAR